MSTYFITGATSGLGRQVAIRLARQGWHHLVLPARDVSKADLLRRELLALGAREVSIPSMDLSSLKSAVLTDLLTGKMRGSHNGAYFNYTGKQLEPASPAKEQWVADDLLLTSDQLLARFA